MNSVSAPIQRLMDSSVAKLMEAGAESAFIICTANEGTGTHRLHKGGGNVYAQQGSVREWLSEQDEKARDRMREKND